MFIFYKKIKLILKSSKKIILIISISSILFFILLSLINHFFKGPNLNHVFFKKYQSYYPLLAYLHDEYNKDFGKEIDLHKTKKNSFLFPCSENKRAVLSLNFDNNFFKNSEKDYYESKNILLGDSFLFGYCVSSEYSIKNNLIKKTKKNFLEFSYPGTTINSQLYYLKKYGKNINYNNVYIFFYEHNDLDIKFKTTEELENLDIQRINYLKKLKKNNNENLKNEINKYKSEFHLKSSTNINHFISLYLSKNLRGLSSFKNHLKYKNKTPDKNKIKIYFNSILSKNFLLEKKIKIIYLPTWERYFYPEWHNKNKFFDLRFEVIKKHSSKNNIFLIDCRKYIDKQKFSSENFYSHYNELGYSMISKCILDKDSNM